MPGPSLLIPGSSVDLGMCSFPAPWSNCHFCHRMKKVNVLPVSLMFRVVMLQVSPLVLRIHLAQLVDRQL